jgi:iron complex transport system substrate-binding protein
MEKKQNKQIQSDEKQQLKEISRRNFLLGAGSVIVGSTIGSGLLSGCKGETTTVTQTIPTTKTVSVPTTVEVPTTIINTTTETVTANSNSETQTIIDMAGREVTLPKNISRVVTLGPTWVLDTALCALGQGSKIINSPGKYNPAAKYLYLLAPQLKDATLISTDSDYAPNLEQLLELKPDVVIAMIPITISHVEAMVNAGLNVVYMWWTESEEIKNVMTLLGQIFNEEYRAHTYVEYFDYTLNRIQSIVNAIPDDEKLRVLNGSLSGLYNNHLISEWWIAAAGGKSVTADIWGNETFRASFSLEQLVVWDPQVIIVNNPSDVDLAYSDPRFSPLSAVINKKVYMAPRGGHTWCQRTPEQPLTVLWVASILYPDKLKDFDLYTEVKHFYSLIFGYDALTNENVDEILSGNITD